MKNEFAVVVVYQHTACRIYFDIEWSHKMRWIEKNAENIFFVIYYFMSRNFFVGYR